MHSQTCSSPGVVATSGVAARRTAVLRSSRQGMRSTVQMADPPGSSYFQPVLGIIAGQHSANQAILLARRVFYLYGAGTGCSNTRNTSL